MIERMFADDGIIDKLTAKNGPLEQFTEAAEILSQLQPVVETLTPTADTLQAGVDRLNRVANSLAGSQTAFRGGGRRGRVLPRR